MAASRFPWLSEKDIANKGLFLPGSDREENTVAAIKAAADKGYAVKIDVQTTSDSLVVVFHDLTLDRMTEKTGPVSAKSYRQLQDIDIGWSNQPMPTLPDILDVIENRVPLYIEVKTKPGEDITAVCAGIRHALEGYKGPVAVMSFDYRVVKWFKKELPRVARGLELGRDVILSVTKRLGLKVALGGMKPDFLSIDINLLPNPFSDDMRKKGMPIIAWTVRHVDIEAIARRHADRIIFEEPAVTGEITGL